ncbi:MAG: DUF4097 family beta strand repeat-containing protein [Thermoanaerobaculia bacterium]|nr:DUF4097 family beta strand repeat-containing protein [Thermoanaerobaculia bacterium]
MKTLMNIAAAALLTGGSLCAAELTEKFDKTFVGKATVGVENENGSVTVKSWDRPEIRVEAEKTAEGNSDAAAAAMKEIRIDVRDEGGTLRIRTVMPKRNGGGFLDWLAGTNVNANVRYTVTVPRKTNLDLETVNGRIEVREVEGVMDLETTNGKIEIAKSSGRVNAETTNGGIIAQLDAVSAGQMELETTNGSVQLEVPNAFRANLDAATTNGSIKSDFPITVQGSMSKTRLNGSLNGGGEQLRIRTTNGSIKILKSQG